MTDTCIPQDGDNICQVIDASTTILLDTGANEAKKLAYDAIKAALSDEEYIAEFAPAVASASFLESRRDAFVVTPPSNGNDDSSGTSTATTIAIASASVAFVLVSIFAYGIFRRMPVNRIKGLATPTGKGSPGHIGIKPAGNYYEGLDDEQPSLFHLDINSESPSNTWSVSDITSEGSIRSGLSRGTSNLERIDEETLDEIELYEDEEEDEDTGPAPKPVSPDSTSHFIAIFDAVDRRNTSQDNGPHDTMESMEMSREDKSDDEVVCAMVPVSMSSEEAQRMLDDFLFPFSQGHDDVEAPAKTEKESQEKPVQEAATKSERGTDEEPEEVRQDKEVEELLEESAQDDSSNNLKVVDEEDEEIDAASTDEDSSSEDIEDSSVTNEEDVFHKIRTATVEDTNVESKVEDFATLTVPEQEENIASCDNTESVKPPQNPTTEDSAIAVREETATEESPNTGDNQDNKGARVDSPVGFITDAEGAIVNETLVDDTFETNQAETPSSICHAGKDEEKKTIDGTQSTIDRVVSLEEPIGLAVHDSSFDDSLALSTYTTESDEEVSVSSFLAKFLAELSTDRICASQCEPPCQRKDESTKE